MQSRQVRRRKFGVICPYLVCYEAEQVQSGVQVAVDGVATLRADESPVLQSEVLLLRATMGARLAAGIEAVGNGDGNTIHRSLVLYLPTQFAKGHVADTLCQFTTLHPLHVQVLNTDGLVVGGEDGGQLLGEVLTDSRNMTLLTSEPVTQLLIIVRPLNALQTLLLGFCVLALGELAAQSCYFSLMFMKSARVMDGDAVREGHGFVQSEVDADGSMLFGSGFRVGTQVFLFGNRYLKGRKELVAILRHLHAKHLAVEAQTLGHLYTTKVGDIKILMLPFGIVCNAFKKLQTVICISQEALRMVIPNIEATNVILLPMWPWIFGTMCEEVIKGSLQVIEGMSRGVLRHLIGEWELLATNFIEVIS